MKNSNNVIMNIEPAWINYSIFIGIIHRKTSQYIRLDMYLLNCLEIIEVYALMLNSVKHVIVLE